MSTGSHTPHVCADGGEAGGRVQRVFGAEGRFGFHPYGSLTEPAAPGLVLMDAWRIADPREPGWTWRRDNPYAGPAGYHDARVDYVLIGRLGPTWPRVESARLAGLEAVQGVWPSDHAAVVVDLT